MVIPFTKAGYKWYRWFRAASWFWVSHLIREIAVASITGIIAVIGVGISVQDSKITEKRISLLTISYRQTKMAGLPLAPVTRIIKKAGAERVSEEASTEMKRRLEDYGTKLAKNAVSLAKHAGRNTVQTQDIRKAAKHPLLFF